MTVVARVVALLVLCLVTEFASPAFARCRNFRAVCDWGHKTCWVTPVNDEIKRGVTLNSGQAVWGALNVCHQAAWNHSGVDFDDISAGCTDPDYLLLGKVIIQRAGGNAGACNQLPE